MKDNSFRKRLVKLRKEKGISQYAIAKELNLTRGQIANYEQGKREPDYDTLYILAEYFDVTIDYLLGRSEVRKFPEPGDNGNGKPDLEAPLREKNQADALLKVSELDSMFDIPLEVLLDLLRQVREKYGPLPKAGGPAAHGPSYPGSDALKGLDWGKVSEDEDKGDGEGEE